MIYLLALGLGLTVGSLALVWGCLKMAARADQAMEEEYQRWRERRLR